MRFLGSLTDLLTDIRTSNRDLAEAIRANTQAFESKQEPEERSLWSVTPLELPEPIVSYYTSEQAERAVIHGWKKAERCFIALTFVVAVLGAILIT